MLFNRSVKAKIMEILFHAKAQINKFILLIEQAY